MTLHMTRRVVLTFAAALTLSTALVGASQAETTLTFLVDNGDAHEVVGRQHPRDPAD